MRIALGFCVLLCLVILGFGIHFVLQEQRQVMSLSATTTAVVLTKQIQKHEYETPDPGDPTCAFEPVVTYRYEAHGQQFTSNRVFPAPFQAGGNIGEAFAQATLARFEIGRDTPVYYQPDSPTDVCLLRRPSLIAYLAILGPVIVLGIIVCFWPSRQAGSVACKQRKGRLVAAIWHLAGLASGFHYFGVAGANYAPTAPWLFGIYTYIGMIPAAVALPSSGLALRVKSGIAISIVGAFIGLLLGGLGGSLVGAISGQLALVAMRWMGYAMLIGVTLFAVLGLLADVEDEASSGREPGRR